MQPQLQEGASIAESVPFLYRQYKSEMRIGRPKPLKKLEQKKWYRHTGYVGHLKETNYATLMATRPTKAMELAVKGMVPSNSIGRAAMLRLRLFEGAEHNHQAQKPEAWEF